MYEFQLLLVAFTVIAGSILTFFSGFGLGTLMLPVMALFFSVDLAVIATGIVHLANNLFKFGLVYKHIHFHTLWRFGLPAIVSAFFGAYLLRLTGQLPTIGEYALYGKVFSISALKVVIGLVMIFFAVIELSSRFSKWQVSREYLPVGGIISGFFGGLSGHQGAFRSAFLAKAGLTKEQFVGTSNAIAILIDVSRLSTYFTGFYLLKNELKEPVIYVAIIAAFLGTIIGQQLMKKVTLTFVQRTVAVLLITMGTLLIAGIL
jgi:uncharacterized membrane protein YfcA